MAALTRDVIRKLAGHRGGSGGVVSLYLDVDGRRYVRTKDYELHLDQLLREAREKHGAHPSDIEQLSEQLRDIDRSRVRGVAAFSSATNGLLERFDLPVPVRNHVAVNASPHVKQLEAIVEHYEPFAVLMVDRQLFRMFLFDLGELVDKTEFTDPLPRHEDDKGDWRRDHVHDHVEAAVHQHLRRAAQRAFEVFQEHEFAHLIVSAADDIANEVERELHSYLRERITARLNLPIHAREPEIQAAALEVADRVEVQREAAAVQRLRDAVGSGNGGVAGLDNVLAALVERRADTLLVSDGFEAPGWRCLECGHMGTRGRACPQCSAAMNQVDDVVEEAVEGALAQGCRVLVCREVADLDVLGRIGALLRF